MEVTGVQRRHCQDGADGAFGWTAEYVANQRSISERSKVWPSHVVTGSSITSALIGQMN